MPQLDIGIFFFEFFLNFLFFWLIYLIKAKKIFPFLNKSIKLRKYKIKKINNFLDLYLKNFNLLNNYLIKNKIILNFLFLKTFNIYFLKLNFLFFLIFKKYNFLFFFENNQIFFIHNQILINKI